MFGSQSATNILQSNFSSIERERNQGLDLAEYQDLSSLPHQEKESNKDSPMIKPRAVDP